MIDLPLVSVIIPVHNRFDLVVDAVESIVSQTYGNIEILIIDDYSDPEIRQSLKMLSKDIMNVRLFFNQENRGPAYSRNIGLANSRGQFVALLDSDDIAVSNRIEKQVDFLLSNPEIDICGGLAYRFYSNVNEGVILWEKPEKQDDIRLHLLFGLPVITSTLMFRSKVFNNFKFDLNFPSCQDYKLIVDLINTYSIINLAEVLVYYRVHKNQITEKQKYQRDYANQVSLIYWSKLGANILDSNTQGSLIKLFNLDSKFSKDDVVNMCIVFNQIWARNSICGFFNSAKLKSTLTSKLLLMLSQSDKTISDLKLPPSKWLTNRFKVYIAKAFYKIRVTLDL